LRSRRNPTSRNIPWLRVAVCKPVIDYVARLGVPHERYLEKHHLPLGDWSDTRAIIPRHLIGLFLEDVASSEGLARLGWDPFIHDHRSNGGPSYAPSSQPTLFSALKEAVARARQHSSIDIYLRETPDALLICRRPNFTTRKYDFELGLSAMAIYTNLIRYYAGAGWSPTRMAVSSPADASHVVSEEFPSTQVLATENTWWLEIPRSELSLSKAEMPLGTGDGLAGADLGFDQSEADYAMVLGRLVRAYLLPSGPPTLQLAAEIAGTTPRTLQRRLGEASRTFSQVLDEARFAVARDLLESTDLKIRDVAHEAGYESASNFTRAFSRYTGVTPRQHRRRQTSVR
jgi:AraC-like DNA-binding protein